MLKKYSHLHKRDEENDGSKGINEEPMLPNRLCIKEENSSRRSLPQEITRKRSDPRKDVEPSTALQHEKSDDLLHEETDDDCGPVHPPSVVADHPEKCLEDEKTKYGNGAVAVFGALSNQICDLRRLAWR